MLLELKLNSASKELETARFLCVTYLLCLFLALEINLIHSCTLRTLVNGWQTYMTHKSHRQSKNKRFLGTKNAILNETSEKIEEKVGFVSHIRFVLVIYVCFVSSYTFCESYT